MSAVVVLVGMAGLLCQAPAGAVSRELTAEEQVLMVDRAYNDAMARNDVAGRARVYADDYVAILVNGSMSDGPTQLRRVQSGELMYESLAVDDVRVRIYGNAAVVTGRKTQRTRWQDQATSGQYRHTRVYISREGRWLLVSEQVTQIPQPAAKAR